MALGFVLRRLATLALSPLGVLVWLLLLALIFRKRLLIAAALVWIYLISLPFTSDRLLGTLEYQFPRMIVEQSPSADAVLVLGGLVADAPFGPGSVEWNDAVDRFDQAVYLIKAGKAPRMVLSGSLFYRWKVPITEPDVLRHAALARNILPEAITVLPHTENTAGEAVAVAKLARELNIRRLILTTSAFHMPRAVLLFRRQGLEIIPFPVDFRTVRSRPGGPLDFIPSAGAAGNSEIATKEFLGLLYYRIFPPSRVEVQ